MAYSFGYSGNYTPSQVVTGVPTTSPGSTGSGSNLSPSCGVEGGTTSSPLSSNPRVGMNDMSGQLLDSSLAALSYPRLGGGMGLGGGMYGTSYPPSEQNPYPSLAMDSSSAFYGSLTGGYSGMKEGGGEMGWPSGGLSGGLTSAYYSYDHPSLAAYGYSGGYDLAARRKNATRESTATLKAWLNEHKKNPYPTKGEKIMLAIITKMTLTQVSTWFANARRRLKKENKMTWEPKNKLDDDDVDVSDDDDKDDFRDDKTVLGDEGLRREMARDDKEEKEGIPLPPSKPKIWSMAELAVCKTPPPGSAQNWQALQNGFSLDPSLRQNPAMSVPALRPNLFMGQGREYAGMETKLNSGLGAEDTPPQTPPNNMKLGLAQHNVIALNPQQAYQAYQGHYTGSSMHYTDNTKLEHHQQYDGMSMAEDCFNS